MRVNNLVLLSIMVLGMMQVILGIVDNNNTLAYFGMLLLFNLLGLIAVAPGVSSKTEKLKR